MFFSDLFIYVNSVCNEAVCLSGCIWAHLTFAPKAFENTTGFHLPKLVAVTVTQHGWIAFATFPWHAMKYLSPSLYTEGLKWSFPYWWQAITHTFSSCIHWKHRGDSLSMLSSLHCCLFYWTICDDARTRTLNYIFLALKRLCWWHRTD